SAIQPLLDYLAHIRHLNLPSWALNLNDYWPQESPPSEALSYMHGTEFSQMCQSHSLLPAYAKRLGSETDLLRLHYHAILYRQACWSLAHPILEQLQSLTIPVSDLERYSSVMDRLGNLEHLRFSLDVVANYDSYDIEDDEYYNGEGTMSADFDIALQAREADLFRAMVQFVKDHTQLFPDRLKTVTSFDSTVWPDLHQTCPTESELEILQMLPPLKKPTSLTSKNLRHFLVHLESTDLGQVQRITSFHPNTWCDTLRENRQFLQRCRALKELEMESLGQGAFNWAVQEKKELKGLVDTTTSNNHTTGQGTFSAEASRPVYLEHGLVPLESVSILENKEPLTDEISDILFAFCHTLKRLVIRAEERGLHLPRSMHIGRGCVDLPTLTYLTIGAAWNKLVVDEQLFNHCPNLIHVDLSDYTSQYQPEDIVACLPANLASLETLLLMGWSALTFHTDTLHSTTLLQELSLSLVWNYDHPFPPTQEAFGIGRPLWTWDWHLPHLIQLSLTVEFAYRFQFKMLHGCPALKALNLDMQTSDEQAIVIISEADLFLPGSGDTDHPTGTPSQQPIVAPSLRSMRLHGPWTINDDLLPQLLVHMCPNLRMLDVIGLNGYTLKELMDAIKSIPNRVEKLFLRDPRLSRESAIELGLGLDPFNHQQGNTNASVARSFGNCAQKWSKKIVQ
ncbi:hypothetical protein BGX23_001507, partial [Mortierella sp. AD031]